jgi:hypothetical protein
MIAALSGTTMQVQSQQSGQVAVSWSGSTTFTHTVSAALSTVKAGDCLTAAAATGATGSAAAFTAATVTVTAPVNGTCGTGFGGGGAGGGTPRAGGSGRPSGFPSGGAGRPAAGAFTTGTVSSVSGSEIVVSAQQRGASGSSSAPTTVTVTTDASTKVTTVASTSSSSLQVGKCVTAQGTADSSGTVAATSVRITDPVSGQCSTFGGNRG